MNSYYVSMIQEVQKRMKEFAYQEAYELIHQELILPYVPSDAQAVLEEYEKECKSHLNNYTKQRDDDILLEWISGSEIQKEKAVSELVGKNLRNYEIEVQTLLDSDLLDEFKGELIEALIEQRIDTPFRIVKNGLDITFIPSAITPMSEDDVLIQTREIFSNWFSNDNPAFYNFCCRLLEQEVLESRPFDFQEVQSLSLAKSIVRLVMEAFGQSEEYLAFMSIKGMNGVVEYPLSIERRGEE